jgi:hypothetical protein
MAAFVGEASARVFAPLPPDPRRRWCLYTRSCHALSHCPQAIAAVREYSGKVQLSMKEGKTLELISGQAMQASEYVRARERLLVWRFPARAPKRKLSPRWRHLTIALATPPSRRLRTPAAPEGER